jgi:hypothetical protein
VESSDTSAVCCMKSEPPGAAFCEPASVVHDLPRNVQKNKNRAASSKEVGPLPQAPPAFADSPVAITQRVITSLQVLASILGLSAQVTLPVREDRVSAHLRLS